MPVVTRRELLEAGVHFGHQTRRWNPKMQRFLYGERSGIYIIDLEKSLAGLEETHEFVQGLGRRRGIVLFIGTKKQAQEVVREEAERCGMFFVNDRWPGGMLTNFQTIRKSIERLKKLEEMIDNPAVAGALTKREILGMSRERDKLLSSFGGIKNMRKLPDALFVVDTKKEEIAVKEANKLGIPVVAPVDSNCDPDVISHKVPGNDDAIRAIRLFTNVIAEAVLEGKTTYDERQQGDGKEERIEVRASEESQPPAGDEGGAA